MPDVTGKKVLILGDSLSAAAASPGDVLRANLAGATVKINAKVGRSARSFYGNEDGAQQIADLVDFAPDVAIVVLGTNDIVVGARTDRASMQQLHDDLEALGAEVWAFGPPAFYPGHRLQAGEPGVVAMMQDIFGGRFMDLRPLTADLTDAGQRTSDGIHFPASTAAIAGQRMAQTFISGGGGIGWSWGLLAAGVIGYFLLR